MRPLMDGAAEQRLKDYFDRIGNVLGDAARRASFATYAMGILGEGERKSIEPTQPERTERDAGSTLDHALVRIRCGVRAVRAAAAKNPPASRSPSTFPMRSK